MLGVSKGLRAGKGPRAELSVDKATPSPPLLSLTPKQGLEHQALLRPQFNQWNGVRSSWALKKGNSNSCASLLTHS